MSTPIEKQPQWNEIVSKLKSKKLRDIAREYKVSVADLQKALERTGQMPKAGEEAPAPAAAPAEEQAAPAAEAAAPAPKKRGRPPGSANKPKAEAPAPKKRGRPAGPEKKAAAAAPSAPSAEGRRGATARLEALRGDLGKVPDGEIAKRAGVARKTVVEFRKKHGIDRYRGAEGAEEAAPKAAEAPKKRGRPAKAEKAEAAPPRAAAAPTPKAEKAEKAPAEAARGASATGRASKLDSFLDIIGDVPDREVAEKSGMTTENVRMYRLRRGIPARWRGGGGGAAKPAAAAPQAGKPAAAARPEGERPRRGRPPGPVGETKVDKALAAYKDQIGKVPDAEIATRAGVSRSAVSAWRQKNKVSASGRPGRRKAAAPAAAPAPRAAAAAAPKAAAVVAAAAPAPRAAAPAAGGSSWRVTASKGNDTRAFGLVAADPVEAAQRAVSGLKGWTIRSIELVGEALPG